MGGPRFPPAPLEPVPASPSLCHCRRLPVVAGLAGIRPPDGTGYGGGAGQSGRPCQWRLAWLLAKRALDVRAGRAPQTRMAASVALCRGLAGTDAGKYLARGCRRQRSGAEAGLAGQAIGGGDAGLARLFPLAARGLPLARGRTRQQRQRLRAISPNHRARAARD